MAANDVILLSDMVEASRAETDGLTGSEQEAYFFAKHYLKRHAPSHDDITAGVVDGTHDGGIDTMHIFVNGLCIRDDAPLKGMGRGADLELVLGQVKNTGGFSEGAIERLIANLPALLDFGRDERSLAQRFNPKVIEVSRRFLRAVRELEMPNLAINVAFASLKATDGPHANVGSKADGLREAIRRCFGTCQSDIEFLDAARMSEFARYRPRVAKDMVLADNPLSTNTTGGYIGVVSLREYHKFISDDHGRIDASMFDANVRDYETGSAVNQSIQDTLEDSDAAVDFWWLNNGVTVVADQIQLNGKILSLVSPQVVNGLQTSHEIYKRGAMAGLDERRSVLVKVIAADQEATKDRIIKATNSQTTLGTSAIRATDKVQRQIEEYLGSVGLYYERRKNFYRNLQVPLAQLVSIDQLGQAVTSTLVQAPHVARGTPSKVFDDEIYGLVFTGSHPLAMYGQAVTIQRTCEQFIRQDPTLRSNVENFSHHLSTLATIAMTRKRSPNAADVAKLDRVPSSGLLRELLPIVQEAFRLVQNSKNYVLFDEMAKDPLSTTRLLEGANRYLTKPASGA